MEVSGQLLNSVTLSLWKEPTILTTFGWMNLRATVDVVMIRELSSTPDRNETLTLHHVAGNHQCWFSGL
jgi:hypothetical protein